MKQFALCLSAAAVLFCASHAIAEENEAGERQNYSTWFIGSIDKAVTLTDAQKKQMADLIAKRDAASAEFQAKNAEALKTAAAALQESYKKTGDANAIAKANKDYQDVYAPMHELMKKSQSDIMNVLTDDQKAKYKTSQLVNIAQGSVGGLKLSDEQIGKLKEACADMLKKDAFEAADWGTVHTKVQELLTPEQKATLEKNQMLMQVKFMFGGGWGGGTGGITPEQTKALEAAYDELAKTLKGEELRAKLNEKAAAMLNDNQKATMAANNKNYALMMVKARYTAAKLTDEQMKQIEAAADEAVKATLQLNDVSKKVSDKVESLLTDEQKEAVKKAQANPRTGAPGAQIINVAPGGAGGVFIINGQAGAAGQVKMVKEGEGENHVIILEGQETKEKK